MKNSNLKNTIIFIDKKAELEGKGKVPKLNLRKFSQLTDYPELPSSENYEKINREITNLKKNERPQSH